LLLRGPLFKIAVAENLQVQKATHNREAPDYKDQPKHVEPKIPARFRVARSHSVPSLDKDGGLRSKRKPPANL
jgi:hypothetical protein